MKAKFEGRCYLCDGFIYIGEEIRKHDEDWVHASCIEIMERGPKLFADVRKRMLARLGISLGTLDKDDPRCVFMAWTRREYLALASLHRIITDTEWAMLESYWRGQLSRCLFKQGEYHG